MSERIENLPTLVVGKTGTGKELVARALHQLSRRSAPPTSFTEVSAFCRRSYPCSGRHSYRIWRCHRGGAPDLIDRL